MRIIVSDTSCLIDLRKASLLKVFLHLPYEILIPNTLFEDELLSFTDVERKMLLDGGLKVMTFRARRLRGRERSFAPVRACRSTMVSHLRSRKVIQAACC
jgi:hypothetical protein